MAQPDVVVGVDFGMTSTGVAYSAGPEWTRPETIQNWPGNLRGAIADKVDSKIAYDSHGNVVSWGFLVNDSLSDENCQYEELFKLHLDPDFQDPFEGAPTLSEARKWFQDYLACIYRAVDRHLADTVPKYHKKRVEFRFSVPTTWKNPSQIAETEQLIRNAGFGRNSSRHSVEISLTEAEAAAVYASKQQYGVGDVFLVCDAGGGTSDVNVLKVVSSGVGQTELEPLSWVEGRAIGSTLIDFRIEKLIAERLRMIQHELKAEPDQVAHRMLRESSRFESFKCNLGDEAMDLPALRLPVPGLPADFTATAACIQNAQMLITKEELQAVFDEQVDKIINLVNEQLTQLKNKHPREVVSYLVLSGGLGSSPYLQSRMKAYYGLGKSGFSNAKYLQTLRVPKPQLSVCHGLVLDRVQQIKQKRVVYKERFCRNSYGIVVRAEYDPKIHINEPVTWDVRDKKSWVEGQIDWFIKQGQKVSVQEGIRHSYSRKVPPDKKRVPWRQQIVMSTLPASELPSSLQKPGARRLCMVESKMPADMKLKNRHWYNTGPQYLRAEFDMQVIIGAADLKFQTLTKTGVLSQGHDSIGVEWAASHYDATHQPKIAELPNNVAPEPTNTAQKKLLWSMTPR